MTSNRVQFKNHRSASVVRSLATVALAVFLLSSGVPSAAQTNDEIEEIRDERKRVQAEKAEQAALVDVADAELDELLDALQVMQAEVNAQEARLSDAQSQLADRENEYTLAIEEVDLKIAEIAALQEELGRRAITSFVTRGDDQASPLIEASDPTQAARMQQLVDEATKTDIEIGEELAVAQEDLEINRAIALASQTSAEGLKEQISGQLTDLEGVRDIQAALSAEAESRLEAQLVRLDEIRRVDANLAAKEEKAVAELAAEIARKSQPARGGGGNGSIPIPPPSEIVTVRGFRVHQSISNNVDRMIGDAAAAGITLGGWGWRDNSTQIRLRKAHCGTSDYAIYQMPSSQCSPPTARPGASMHERGMALDLTYGGRTIGTRSSAAYKWLAANAANYGFYNLPSEPWHWSTNGR